MIANILEANIILICQVLYLDSDRDSLTIMNNYDVTNIVRNISWVFMVKSWSRYGSRRCLCEDCMNSLLHVHDNNGYFIVLTTSLANHLPSWLVACKNIVPSIYIPRRCKCVVLFLRISLVSNSCTQTTTAHNPDSCGGDSVEHTSL